jgi:hypothetical protein
MSKIKLLFLLFLIIVFLVGLYVTMFYGMPVKGRCNKKEGFEDNAQKKNNVSRCPDLLVKKGNALMLYNTTKPIIEGENPIPFFNLDEYINYLEIQRKKGIVCPVLYLQQENDAQGKYVYRMRPSPFELNGGTPSITEVQNPIDNKLVVKHKDSSRSSSTYNTNQYPSFDPYGQYVGVYTDIDKIHDSTSMNKISDNPMDPNWAGTIYTQQMVDSGKYADNSITKPILFQPKVAFLPGIPGAFPPPRDEL